MPVARRPHVTTRVSLSERMSPPLFQRREDFLGGFKKFAPKLGFNQTLS